MDEKTIELLTKLNESDHGFKSHVWAKNELLCALADTIKAITTLPNDGNAAELSSDSELTIYSIIADMLASLNCTMDIYDMSSVLLNSFLQDKLK